MSEMNEEPRRIRNDDTVPRLRMTLTHRIYRNMTTLVSLGLFIVGLSFISVGALVVPHSLIYKVVHEVLIGLGIAAGIGAVLVFLYEYFLRSNFMLDAEDSLRRVLEQDARFRQLLKETEEDIEKVPQELEQIRSTGLRIFISYRREESAGHAGRIADTFVEHFGEDSVFRDIESIEPGLDFAETIKSAVSSSDVLFAVIGKNWSTATDEANQKQLENPDDYVRLEIATALKRNIRIIPLVMQGASMPRADELPDDLVPLARLNAFELYDVIWKEQVQKLMTLLDNVARAKTRGNEQRE